MNDSFNKSAKLIKALLPLRGEPVGVRLLYTEQEYESSPGRELIRPINYCQAVKAAFHKNSVKLSTETSGCRGSNKALRFFDPGDNFYSGNEGVNMGLYDSKETAAKVAWEVAYSPRFVKGVYVAPLVEFEGTPHAVLLLCDSRDAMRVMQGYTYHHGFPKGMQITGNQAVCVECTMLPIKTNGINVSMLCAGTRHKAQWSDSDIMIGISGEQFASVVDGVLHTVNPIEYPARKKEIEGNLIDIGIRDFEIDYEKTYFKRFTQN